jgi:CheY-like chemotaxis protein
MSTNSHRLNGLRILVAEDEYFIAEEIVELFEEAGANVIGPAQTVDDAMALVSAGKPLHGAVLDISLHGEMVFPVADELVRRGVPFVFTTGYDESTLPARFSTVTRCEKPVDPSKILGALFGAGVG